jgi:hypothetical protein
MKLSGQINIRISAEDARHIYHLRARGVTLGQIFDEGLLVWRRRAEQAVSNKGSPDDKKNS